jgi:hypothetical protein
VVRNFFSVVLGVLALWALGGCTPAYNWREWTVADGRAVIMFPARIQTEQRQIDLEGVATIFSLTSASVGEAVFSVGFTPLSDALTEAQRAALLKKVVSALAARAGKSPPENALKGESFTFEMVVAGKPSLMMARVLEHRGMLLQVVASGPKQSLANENALEFVRSLRLK